MNTTFQNSILWGTAGGRANFVDSNYQLYKKLMYLNGSNNAVENKYKSSADVTMSIMNFLQLQKVAKETTTNIRMPDPDTIIANMQSDEAKTLLNTMNGIAGLQFLQNFYDMYMSPIDKCDLTWRLGSVTGIKENLDASGNVVKNEQVDKYGRLPTTTNFRQMFLAQYYSPFLYRPLTTYVPYVNLFFPPYKIQTTGFQNDSGETLSLQDYIKLSLATLNKGGEIGYLKDSDGNIVYDEKGNPLTETKTVALDLSQMLSTRGNFTYRTPAFKAVNDNIIFLQWLFEQTSGIVSTYLTEWDLSLYIQEGLISNSRGKLPEYISLVHRLAQDNPSDYNDYKANGYGLVNAAVSKLFKTNLERWDPKAYPLSAYWCSYPDWEKHQATYSMVWRDWDGITVRFPKFYWDAKTKTIPDGYNQYTTFAEKLRKWDEENAMLAGWYNWTDMKTYQALYSTHEDSLSDIDISLLEKATGYHKKIDVADDMLSNAFGIDVASGGEIGEGDGTLIQTLGDIPEEYLDANGNYVAPTSFSGTTATNISNGSTPDGSLKICGVKVGGSLLKMIKQVVSIFKGASKKQKNGKKQVDSAQNNGNTFGASASSTEGGVIGGSGGTGNTGGNTSGNGSPSSINYIPGISNGNTANANTGLNGGLAGSNNLAYSLGMEPKTADFANTTGIPQTNPTLYGGPHGQHYSPMTVQAYMQEDNAYMRDLPRIDSTYNNKNWNNETKPQYFTGLEKYFTKSSILGGEPEYYEHSFSEGKMRQKNGLTSYRWAYAKCWINTTSWFIAQTGGRGRCLRYPIWPDYINGYWIHWDPNYYCRHPWNRWAYWRGPYSWWTITTRNGRIASAYGLGTSLLTNQYYYNYTNRTSRYWYSWSSRCWYISTYSPCRLGTYQRLVYTPYKKYFLHSEPLAHWTITKIRTRDYHVIHLYNTGWWGWWNYFWYGWFGYRVSLTIATSSYKEKWRLKFKDYPRTYYSSYYNYYGQVGWRYFLRSSMEDKVRKNMVDMGLGLGATAKMIFLQNDSYYDRINNGAANVFRCPVKHEQAKFAYYIRCKHTKSCRRVYYHYILCTGYEDIITVDLNRCDWIYTQTDYSPNSNYFMGRYPWKNKMTKPSKVFSPMNFIKTSYKYYTPYVVGSQVYTSYTGFEGWGVLGTIQSLDINNVIDNPPFENFSKYMMVKDPNKYNKALVDINYKYYRIWFYNTTSIWWNGMQCWAEGGFPVYLSYSMDRGLRKTLARIFTRATLYLNEQWPIQKNEYSNFGYYYNVEITDAIRVLYAQLLWQKSFLESEREILTGTMPNTNDKLVDFNSINRIMVGDPSLKEPGIISQRTYKLSDPTDPQIDIGEDRKYYSHEIYGYNPWIAEIRNWISDNASINADKQNSLRKKFNSRISYYEDCINTLIPIAHKSATTISFNELQEFANMVTALNSELVDNPEIENFMMGYLNVLYEYRRFFVNKRFNKQDGSMWLCRALESAIPMVVQNAVQTNIGNLQTLSGRKQYSVAFYQVHNTTTNKISAIKNGEGLEDDRICIVYVKISYVTEADYNQALLDYAEGKITEPTVVRVLPYHLTNYGEFKAAYNNPKLRKTVVNNGSPMVSGGSMGSKIAKYYQFEHTIDSEGNAIYKYKYAKKPQDGLYRLESKEFLANENNKIYNNTISGLANYEDKQKYVDDRIDTAIWYISWGEPSTPYGTLPKKNIKGETLNIENKTYKENGVSTEYKYGTPGLYNLTNGIDIMKIADTVNAGLSDPISILCSTQTTSDYWTVKVNCTYPRQIGFLNDVKLVLYNEDNQNKQADIETSISGVMSYALYPIMENQVNQIPNMSDVMYKMVQNMAAVTSNPSYSKV